MKKSERVLKLMEKMGAKEVKSSSRKYRCFETENNRYWVGKAGALRVGKSVGESISVTGGLERLFKRYGVEK